MRLLWSHRARRDLVAITGYIVPDSPPAARRWAERLRTAAARAAEMPLAGRVVPELRRDDVREVLVRSYRIVHQVRDDTVVVLTVFEGHRLLPVPAVESD